MSRIFTVALLSCSGVLGFAVWSFGQVAPAALKPANLSPTADGQQGATPAVQDQDPTTASPENTKKPISGVDDTTEKKKAHPLQDIGQSGVNWVFPFKKARQQAEEEKRLLLIIPITGVKVTAKGDW